MELRKILLIRQKEVVGVINSAGNLRNRSVPLFFRQQIIRRLQEAGMKTVWLD